MHKLLPSKQWPVTNDAEMLRGVHVVLRRFFEPILPTPYYKPFAKSLMSKVHQTAAGDAPGFLKLLEHFAPDNLVGDYERSCFARIQAFVELVRPLISMPSQLF